MRLEGREVSLVLGAKTRDCFQRGLAEADTPDVSNVVAQSWPLVLTMWFSHW